MEQTKPYNNKLIICEKAIEKYEQLLNYDLTLFDDIATDGMKNGQIQKFEYCSELVWKLIKQFLFVKEGLDDYELLIKMIDDRNKLSHIYKEEFFDKIHSRLNSYLIIMKRVIEKIKNAD